MIGSVRWPLVAVLLLLPAVARAHSGPPFPMVSDRDVGPYRVAVWTDPDTTDDSSAGGQFWVRIDRPDGTGVDSGTHAEVTVRSLDTGVTVRGTASPVGGDVSNQFVAVNMNREGRFAVHVAVDGPAGRATVDGEVDATYDLRPPPYLLAVYAMPFVLIGWLWVRAMRRRRP